MGGAVSGEELAHARDCRVGRARRGDSRARRPGPGPVRHRRCRYRSQSRCAGGRGAAAFRRPDAGAHAPGGAGRWRHRPAHRAGGPAGQCRCAADERWCRLPMSGSTPISRKCSWPTCASASRSPSPPISMAARSLSWPCLGPGRRLRLGLRAAAGAERQRQLDQDRAARAGAHRAGSRRVEGPSVARGAFSVSAQVDVHDQSGPMVSSATPATAMHGDTGDDTSAATDTLIAQILAANRQ